MTHFGMICPSGTQHINTMFPQTHKLRHRGHHITVFNIPDVKPKLLAVGFDFQVMGESKFLPEKIASLAQKRQLKGFAALQHPMEACAGIKRFLQRECGAVATQQIPVLQEAVARRYYRISGIDLNSDFRRNPQA